MPSTTQAGRNQLADRCEERITFVLDYWGPANAIEHAQRAAAIRDLAEAAVLLRTQQIREMR